MSNEYILHRDDIQYFIRRNEIIQLIHVPANVIETNSYNGNKLVKEQWSIHTIHNSIELTKKEYESIYEWLFAKDINIEKE